MLGNIMEEVVFRLGHEGQTRWWMLMFTRLPLASISLSLGSTSIPVSWSITFRANLPPDLGSSSAQWSYKHQACRATWRSHMHRSSTWSKPSTWLSPYVSLHPGSYDVVFSLSFIFKYFLIHLKTFFFDPWITNKYIVNF